MGIQVGPLHMRRSIYIEAPRPRVWAEFESKEKIDAWFGTGHDVVEFEPHLGGAVDIDIGVVTDDQGKATATRIHCVGQVIVFEAEQEITFETRWTPHDARPMPMLWTFRLTSIYDGTLVEIIHHGYERLGAGAADALQGNEEGWDAHHLIALREIVTP